MRARIDHTAVTLSTICVAPGSQRAQIRRGLGNHSNTILLSHLTPFLCSREQQSVILPQSDSGPDRWVLLSEVHVSTLSLQQRCSGFIISVMIVWVDTTSKVQLKASVMIDPDATRATGDSVSFFSAFTGLFHSAGFRMGWWEKTTKKHSAWSDWRSSNPNKENKMKSD